MEGSSGEGIRAIDKDLSLAQNAASCLPNSDSRFSTTLAIVFVLNVSARSTRMGRELISVIYQYHICVVRKDQFLPVHTLKHKAGYVKIVCMYFTMFR